MHYGQNMRIKLCPFSESAAETCHAGLCHFHKVKLSLVNSGSRRMLTCTARWSPDLQPQNSLGTLCFSWFLSLPLRVRETYDFMFALGGRENVPRHQEVTALTAPIGETKWQAIVTDCPYCSRNE